MFSFLVVVLALYEVEISSLCQRQDSDDSKIAKKVRGTRVSRWLEEEHMEDEEEGRELMCVQEAG